MLENYNKYKLLKIFLFSPTESFRLRELSRLSKISPPSVMAYLKEFEKKELTIKYEKRGVPFYKSNFNNEKFRQYIKLATLYELYECNVIDYLWQKFAPETIIFYGSYSKGEATEDSDVDIFIVGADIEREPDVSEFEKKTGLKFHILGKKNLKKIPTELKANLINGVILKGYLNLS